MKVETNIRPMSRYAQKQAERSAGIRDEFAYHELPGQRPLPLHKIDQAKATSTPAPKKVAPVETKPPKPPPEIIPVGGSGFMSGRISSKSTGAGYFFAMTKAGERIYVPFRILPQEMVVIYGGIAELEVERHPQKGLRAIKVVSITPPASS